jgi:hypothetical protein
LHRLIVVPQYKRGRGQPPVPRFILIRRFHIQQIPVFRFIFTGEKAA